MTTRLFFRSTTARATTVANGHAYVGDPNTITDAADADVATLVGAGGWAQGPLVGTTAQRPGSPSAGTVFIDLSLVGAPGMPTPSGRVILWDGANWRDLLTGAAV